MDSIPIIKTCNNFISSRLEKENHLMILQKLGEITAHKISGRLNVIDSAAP